jgi:hypothetical protein
VIVTETILPCGLCSTALLLSDGLPWFWPSFVDDLPCCGL